MYTSYEVVLVAEDGVYVLAQFNSELNAIDYIDRNHDNYGDGQRLELQQQTRSF